MQSRGHSQASVSSIVLVSSSLHSDLLFASLEKFSCLVVVVVVHRFFYFPESASIAVLWILSHLACVLSVRPRLQSVSVVDFLFLASVGVGSFGTGLSYVAHPLHCGLSVRMSAVALSTIFLGFVVASSIARLSRRLS